MAEGADLVVANGVRHSFLVVLSSPASWYVVNAIVVVVTSVGAAWLVRHFSWLTIFYKVDVSCVFMVAMDGIVPTKNGKMFLDQYDAYCFAFGCKHANENAHHWCSTSGARM